MVRPVVAQRSIIAIQAVISFAAVPFLPVCDGRKNTETVSHLHTIYPDE